MLVHGGGQKGSGVLTKLRKLGRRHRGRSPRELQAVGVPRLRRRRGRAAHGASIDQDAADFLVQAVGQDLRSLSAAADQLTSDFPGEPLTAEKVKQYFGGRAEAKSFAVADAAFSGRRDGGARGAALGARRRHAAGAGHQRVRRRRPRPGPLQVGAPRGCATPTWPARSACRRGSCAPLRDQSRGWSDAGIARAIRAIAQADADIKGAASDASYTLERLVLTVTAPARSSAEQMRR